MLSLPPTVRVFIALDATDMRKAFDGLASETRRLIEQDPLSGHLFAFFNRRRTMVKVLYWDRNGYCLVAKRLERGTFHPPRTSEHGTIEVEPRSSRSSSKASISRAPGAARAGCPWNSTHDRLHRMQFRDSRNALDGFASLRLRCRRSSQRARTHVRCRGQGQAPRHRRRALDRRAPASKRAVGARRRAHAAALRAQEGAHQPAPARARLGELRQEQAQHDTAALEAPAVPERPTDAVPRLRQHRGRRTLPAHLPREEIRITPTEEQLAATSGGMRKMSEERSEVLEYVAAHCSGSVET